jgi:hypothetical protein
MTATFDSLTKALEDWFGKPLAELPEPQLTRVKCDHFPKLWDYMTADQRRGAARHWDFDNDPATEEERTELFNMVCKILDLESMPAATPLELESKNRQLDELRKKLGETEAKIEKLAPGASRTKYAVASDKIVAAFVVKSHNNETWWNVRMRDAIRYDLESCRARRGAGLQRPSYWYPDAVAGWLVEKEHMTKTKVARILRSHFPQYVDIADLLESSDG